MSLIKKVLFFFILPILGILFYNPATLGKALPLITIVAAFFVIVGVLLMRGYSTVLTFAIFLNGMNAIVRLMMLVSNAFTKNGVFQPAFAIFTFCGLAISFFLMLRLDKADVRKTMVR
ncbi:MAG: hypothetical protein Q8N39_00895 [Pelolinea sp.]|nr:hypothetical protein [Pelolinea sp.]